MADDDDPDDDDLDDSEDLEVDEDDADEDDDDGSPFDEGTGVSSGGGERSTRVTCGEAIGVIPPACRQVGARAPPPDRS